MKTQRAYYDILDRVFKTGGMTEDMEKDIETLKGELDEREGILRKYGEAYDGESDDYEWKAKPNEYQSKYDEMSGKYNDLSGKYNDLVERYNRKFFAGGSSHETDKVLYEGDNPTPDTAEKGITVNELFKEVK